MGLLERLFRKGPIRNKEEGSSLQACGFIFNISGGEWLFVISMIGAVTACEMINSAIEATVDLVTSDIKPLAKIAKDAASAATLVLSITSLIGATIIFTAKIINIL